MWHQIKELIRSVDRSSVGRPILHEILERPLSSLSFYKEWFFSVKKNEALDWIYSNFEAYSKGEKTDRSIAFLDTPSKKGFVIYLSDKPPFIQDPEHLMDLLKSKVLEMNYNLYTSDIKTFSTGDFSDEQQRHYLKPPLDFVPDQKLSQLFGNISIDLILRDGKPYLFKFSSTTYQDHLFEKAKSFERLMAQLFTT